MDANCSPLTGNLEQWTTGTFFWENTSTLTLTLTTDFSMINSGFRLQYSLFTQSTLKSGQLLPALSPRVH